MFDRSVSLERTTALMKKDVRRLVPPIAGRPSDWAVTLADVVAPSPDDQVAQVRRRVAAALDGWRPVLQG